MSTVSPPLVIISPTFKVAPEHRHDPIALMVAILNDETLCASFQRLATPGHFGEVVRDLALTLAGAA